MTAHLDELLHAFDADRPFAQARTIPSAWYHDAELYDLERRKIFGNSWQLVARTDQLTQPGNFVTTDIAGEPVLVVRDDQGTLRAFHNVCRHRAAQVINLPQGKLTKLRCRYHGWTYDLQGQLRGTPEFDGVEEFCKEEQGLMPLAVAAWGPFVFAHERTPSLSLAETLAPLPEKSAGLGLEKLRFVGRREYDIACNWKVFVDNYQDGGYHVNTVHPGLAGRSTMPIIARKTSLMPACKSVRSSRPTIRLSARCDSGSHAYYWWLFPNLMINIYQGVMDTNLVLPLGTDRCRVIFDFYFADTEGEANQKFIADSIAVAHQVQLEDLGVCAEVQKGLHSKSYDTGRFSVKRESGGYHFHQLLAKWLHMTS